MTAIYLDHAAATPIRPEVRAAMSPYLEGVPGNPSSVHRWGRDAREALEGAREATAALLGVRPREVRFVRGGTESINLAIQGRAAALPSGEGHRRRFVRSTLEHSAVSETMDALARRGFPVQTLAVDSSGGFVSPGPVLPADTALVSCQWVNHETGMVLPLPELARASTEAGVPLHVDAVQAAGKVPLDLDTVPATLLSLSGHKLGGPRAVGLLVVRDREGIAPILFGGTQEDGLRPGTEDVAGAVGFARALEVSVESLTEEARRLERLRDHLETRLVERIPDLRVHGGAAPRAPHILSVGVPDLCPRDILPGALDVDGVAASVGSACRSGSTRVSPVLESLYGDRAPEAAPLRLSLGWSSTEEDVERAAEIIPGVVERVLALGVGA